ncbi:MAG: hypothetical protein GYB64_19900 [Chloroflexi bacterium]|nr:hypothetical protein [Chloroflexota bacterium]
MCATLEQYARQQVAAAEEAQPAPHAEELDVAVHVAAIEAEFMQARAALEPRLAAEKRKCEKLEHQGHP